MAQYTGINLSGSSPQELTDAIIAMNRSMEYQMANLDSDNVREIGGWRVGPTVLSSKSLDVGMSTGATGADPVRFWAGAVDPAAAPYRVHNSGKLVATNAVISGDITMSKGSITWGAVGAPLYTDIQGTKPPANADNTDAVITVNGSNFTKVAGAYVYSGPANYSQISGGPPTNADNTASTLPSSLGINFTKIGSDYIYTGTLNANQINAGTINANYINGGTLSGVEINVATNLTVGNRIQIGTLNDNTLKQLQFNSTANISNTGFDMSLSSNQLDFLCSTVTFGQTGTVNFGNATILGANFTAKFG